jgi:hypothetical protein
MTFQPSSRYFSIETASYETPDGKVMRFVGRRFLPALDRFTLLQEHLVTEGERLDNITARYLGDPEQYWRLCDANPVMHPEQMEIVGRRIRITLPEGIPGMPHA